MKRILGNLEVVGEGKDSIEEKQLLKNFQDLKCQMKKKANKPNTYTGLPVPVHLMGLVDSGLNISPKGVLWGFK